MDWISLIRLEEEEDHDEDEEEEEVENGGPGYNRRKVLVNNSGVPETDEDGELVNQDYCTKMYLKVRVIIILLYRQIYHYY